MTAAILIGCAVASYFLGSIPTGFLWGKARGIDIRRVGSGNIGATNVMRALGKGPGLAVLLIDVSKGFLPVYFAPRLFPDVDRTTLQIVCCLFVTAGHNWTCWLKFKGGKGVATSSGAMLAILPVPFLWAFGVWIILFGISRYVSLASIGAAMVMPIATWFHEKDTTLLVFTAVLAVVVIYKHKSNIQRLLAGTENRIGKRRETGGKGAMV